MERLSDLLGEDSHELELIMPEASALTMEQIGKFANDAKLGGNAQVKVSNFHQADPGRATEV